MSNKIQLQTNNTALDALITRVNVAKNIAASLPEAGGGSGGEASLETCTVTISGSQSLHSIFYYTAVENGIITVKNATATSLPVTLSSCLCNSMLSMYSMSTISSTIGAEVLAVNGYTAWIKITTTNGTTALVDLVAPGAGH